MSIFDSDYAWRYCSDIEGEERQRSCDVHFCEATFASRDLPSEQRILDPCRAVTKFVRTGSESLHHSLSPRNSQCLHDTVKYLSYLWCDAANTNTGIGPTYAFVMDRCASVRQELVPMAAEAAATETHNLTDLYLTLVRVYLLIGQLCNQNYTRYPWFDARLHAQTLQSCVAAGLNLNLTKGLASATVPAPDVPRGEGVLELATLLNTCTMKEKGDDVTSAPAQSSKSQSHSQSHETLQLLSLSLHLGVCFDRALSALTTPETGVSTEAVMRAVLCPPYIPDWNIPLQWTDKAAAIEGTAATTGAADTLSGTWGLVLQMVGHMRRSNPASALLTINNSFNSLEHVVNRDEQEAPVYVYSPKLYVSQMSIVVHCLLGLVPGLQLWRLLLMNVAANRGERVPLSSICSRLYTDEDTCKAVARALGLPIAVVACALTPVETIPHSHAKKTVVKMEITLRSRICSTEEVRAALEILRISTPSFRV